MTIAELKDLWEKEKVHYQKSEVGSGVQAFVWETLQSEALFGLKKGLKSTLLEKRQQEFLLEESNKAGQADAVIFVDSDIVIPVEVERFQNAQYGEWQILKYRTAFDKKYGILTDGYDWRFYYGSVEDNKYYQFDLSDMLDQSERFQTFWQEYVKPENYYLSYFAKDEAITTPPPLPVDNNRQRFFEDVTEIIKKLKNKLINAGYFQAIEDERERDKKSTEIAYSYLIQFILYKTLVDNEFIDFKSEFEHKSEVIYRNLQKGSYNSILMILEGMSTKISENIYKPFHAEQEIIFEQVKKIVHAGEDNLLNVAPFLDIYVFIKKFSFANVQNDIFGIIYENYLKELYEDQKLGQYFTDPAVVDFMLREIGYTATELKARNHSDISIIDPSCGSGTFLYSAVREIMASGDFTSPRGSELIEENVLNNVFGMDIAEFPLYLAEMGILMKMLPSVVNQEYNNPVDKKLKLFITEDSLAEFMGEMAGRVKAGSGEQIKLALGWHYDGFMRDERDLDEMKRSLNTVGGGAKTTKRQRFDYVIGNPPYISYNESSKSGVKYFELLKNSKSSASLNDVYGWNLHSVPNDRKKYSPKPNLYGFFMALGFALLKDGGKFAYIIPQTLLTAGDLDVLRYELSQHYTIEKLYTFTGKLFIGRGTNSKREIATSSLVIICKKQKPSRDHQVLCRHFEAADQDVASIFNKVSANDKDNYVRIPQPTLQTNVKNWNFIQWDPRFIELYQKYQINTLPMSIYYEHKQARQQFGSAFYFDVGFTLNKDEVLAARIHDDDLSVLDWKEQTGLIVRTGNHYYPKDYKKIGLTQNSQGYEILTQSQKIIWRVQNPDRFCYSDEAIIFNMGKASVIATNDVSEAHYLLALLNCPLNTKLLSQLLRIGGEKEFLLPIKAVKQYVRVPKITAANEPIKRNVIEQTKKLTARQKMTLAEAVNLNVLMQKFDRITLEHGKLQLHHDDSITEQAIRDGFELAVSQAIKNFKASPVTLSALRRLPLYNQKDDDTLINEINDAIYKLYELTSEEKELIKNLQI